VHHKSIAAFAAVIAIATHGADGAEREAGTYPARPIRLMVPQNAGASVDNVSRILAAKMGEELGQQIVADNRAGAGGTLAAEVVAHAAPDGQTLLAVATGTAVISPQTFKKLSYDPIKDFEYISLFAITQNVLVVHPSLPVKSVKELLEYAKANSGKLNMANAGSASPHSAESAWRADRSSDCASMTSSWAFAASTRARVASTGDTLPAATRLPTTSAAAPASLAESRASLTRSWATATAK